MGSAWGNRLKLTIFGESHGKAVGLVMEGLPAGMMPDWQAVDVQMSRRSAVGKPWATPRQEMDRYEIQSGYFENRLTGTPLCMRIENQDKRSIDYAPMRLPRPGHADLTGHIRYGGHEDYRGGGHFSGRLTAPLVLAGSLARQVLQQQGIEIGGHVISIGSQVSPAWTGMDITKEELLQLQTMDFACRDKAIAEQMKRDILDAAALGDSLGGEIQCAAVGLPAGVGSPLFDGLESRIAQILFAVPAVKGLSFGTGFGFAAMTGSTANDAYTVQDGKIQTTTNHNGGILGGITSGMPMWLNVVIKPTPSISIPQQTVDLQTLKPETLVVQGRHDPCVVPRAVPVIEAVVALAILDAWMESR